MKFRLAILASLLVIALVPAPPAAALDWGLGAEIGGSIFIPDYTDAEGIASFGWPVIGPALNQSGGLRLSFGTGKPAHEIWAGTAFSSRTTGGRTNSATMLTANYQYRFQTQGRVAPFLTVGGGLNHAGSEDYGASGAIFGAGAGLSRRVSDDAGRLRAEVRYDQQAEGHTRGRIVIPKGGSFAFKLGFDLWVR